MGPTKEKGNKSTGFTTSIKAPPHIPGKVVRLEDRELVQKLLAKDPEAERLFFVTYRDRLCKACFYLLGHRDPEAEDVVQETFAAAFDKISEFEFRSSLFHWLFRICMNRCYRSEERRVGKECRSRWSPP